VSRLPLTLGVAAGVVLIDQVTKAMAVARLEGEPAIEILGQWLRLTFVRNPGAAFSLAGNYTIVISVVAIIVAVAIVRTARTLTNPWWAVVLGGILGGAVGNLIDRILREPGPFRGHVVDFLAFPNFPVFNVADMALVGSAALAVLLSLKGVEMGDAAPAEAPADAAPDAGPEAAPEAAPTDPPSQAAPADPAASDPEQARSDG
jgi:signal peptidase II